MARYRKKPVEAFKWFNGMGQIDGIVYIEAAQNKLIKSFKHTEVVDVKVHHLNRFYVITIHDQRAYLADGDWVLPEPDGIHYYPCKPDIFEATYEKVED